MGGVERAWYPIQNLRQGTPLPGFLDFGAWPAQKRPAPEYFIRPAWPFFVLLEITVLHRGMGTGISEASKRVPIFSFATQGGKQVSSHFRQRNWVQAREAQIWFPAG